LNKRITFDKIASDRFYRLNNLYKIVDKDGQLSTFRMLPEQEDLYRHWWYRNIILKARQLGFSTLIGLYLLDEAIWNTHTRCAIIAQDWPSVEKLFARVKLAYEQLPQPLKELVPAVRMTQSELELANGSSVRVGLTMRGDTIHRLHVSEMGKICAESPDKAEEIVSGAFEAVPKDGQIFIESTAEGPTGYFYEMCQRAMLFKASNQKHTFLDYRFFFYPWWRNADYALDVDCHIDAKDHEYFMQLYHEHGIYLSGQQKTWWVKKRDSLGDLIYQEYPSYPDESFLAARDLQIFGKQLSECRHEGRITRCPYNANLPVHTAMDLGYTDYTSIWFFQMASDGVRIIDYYESTLHSIEEDLVDLQRKPYLYGQHFAPHDAAHAEKTSGMSVQKVAKKLGFELHIIPRCKSKKLDIDKTKALFSHLYFDAEKCKTGIERLQAYRKKKNSAGVIQKDTAHDESSHAADALMNLANAMERLGRKSYTQEQIEDVQFYRQNYYQ
jgi:hypothetical protein